MEFSSEESVADEPDDDCEKSGLSSGLAELEFGEGVSVSGMLVVQGNALHMCAFT